MKRWPLFLIAAPAAVSVWSGWIGLGELAGFGIVHPLPGIVPSFQLNTAITLPIGIEAYGAFALGAWLAPDGVPDAARKFAKRSAIGALVLGMLGQISYHLLAAAHATHAPWPVVVLVSCLPVAVLGLAVALTHLLRDEPDETLDAKDEASGALPTASAVISTVPRQTQPDAVIPASTSAALDAPDAAVLVSAPATASASDSAPMARPKAAPGRHGRRTPERIFRAQLDAGKVPSVRAIQRECKVGRPRAQEILDDLAALVTNPVSEPREIVEVGG